MKQKETVILYHAYGAETLHQQVLFSILTLHYHIKAVYESIQIIIYTDKPNAFKELMPSIPISIELITNDLINEYKGINNFVHRVKIKIIQDCMEKYKKNIFYLDSDTYFTECPRNLLNKIDITTSIMNSNDYDLNNADDLYENEDWLMIRRAIRDFEYKISGTSLKIQLSTRMWNAGVIGLSYENRDLLNDVLDLTDQIYYNRKVFTAEQFAFSYFLQNRTNLISSENVIFHYWPNFVGKYWKRLYSYHFKKFFRKHRSTSIGQKATLAFELTTNHQLLTKSSSESFFSRMLNRIRMAFKILKTGKI